MFPEGLGAFRLAGLATRGSPLIGSRSRVLLLPVLLSS